MNNNSPLPKKYLRPEASSLHWDRLYDSQLKALIKILAILEESIGNLEIITASNKQKSSQHSTPPWFDVYRESRIVLLDGARGTGKTSLMLTLVQSCTNGYLNQNDRSEEISDKRYSKINDKLKKLKNRIIWLEPLDMEPLPGPANLLASVLARIESAVKPYYQTSVKTETHREPSGILELCPDYLEGLQKLHRLQADVALSWEGNIAQRGAHIDPDAYSSEVNRTENARLALNRELSNVLNHLAGNIPQACGITDLIFVLPVDDLDLNPVRCLEVLRLLRMVNVPRLFILVLGDLNMIEIVLSLKHSGELISADGEYSSRISEDEYTSIRKQANSVAYNVMRKLLPPGQRIKIEPMQILEALNYKPLWPESTLLPSLHLLLKKIKIKLKAISQEEMPENRDHEKVDNLWDFLFYPIPYPNRDILVDDLESCVYRARMILKVPPRHIADWWALLQREEDHYSNNYEDKDEVIEERFLDNLGKLCRSAIGEDISITHEQRQKYREALRKSKLTDEWELFLGVMTIPNTGPIEEIRVPKTEKSSTVQREFHLCHSNGWRLYPWELKLFRDLDSSPIINTDMLQDNLESLTKDKNSFSEETASALLLFHDLHALGTREKISRKRINIYRPIQIWAKTTWKYGSSSESILWPIPEFLSSWGYDIFLSHWDVAVKSLSEVNVEDRPLFAVYAWIDAATAVLGRESSPLVCSEVKIKAIITNNGWEKVGTDLSTRLNNLFKKNTTEITLEDSRKSLIERWLKRVINLLMPEISGIKDVYIKCLLSQIVIEDNDFWKNTKVEVEQLRRKIFEALNNMGSGDDITRLTDELKTKGDQYLSDFKTWTSL
jgi:hypothetical protein